MSDGQGGLIYPRSRINILQVFNVRDVELYEDSLDIWRFKLYNFDEASLAGHQQCLSCSQSLVLEDRLEGFIKI